LPGHGLTRELVTGHGKYMAKSVLGLLLKPLPLQLRDMPPRSDQQNDDPLLCRLQMVTVIAGG
jgi:hypothetical protein